MKYIFRGSWWREILQTNIQSSKLMKEMLHTKVDKSIKERERLQEHFSKITDMGERIFFSNNPFFIINYNIIPAIIFFTEIYSCRRTIWWLDPVAQRLSDWDNACPARWVSCTLGPTVERQVSQSLNGWATGSSRSTVELLGPVAQQFGDRSIFL